MTEQDKDELRQDLLQEAREEDYHESRMRTDYDFAKMVLIDDNTELSDAVDELHSIVMAIQNKLEEYGYQIDRQDILGEVLWYLKMQK